MLGIICLLNFIAFAYHFLKELNAFNFTKSFINTCYVNLSTNVRITNLLTKKQFQCQIVHINSNSSSRWVAQISVSRDERVNEFKRKKASELITQYLMSTKKIVHFIFHSMMVLHMWFIIWLIPNEVDFHIK